MVVEEVIKEEPKKVEAPVKAEEHKKEEKPVEAVASTEVVSEEKDAPKEDEVFKDPSAGTGSKD